MSLVKVDPDRRSDFSLEYSHFRAHCERLVADTVRCIGRQWRLSAAFVAIALALASLVIPQLTRSYSAMAFVYPNLFSSEGEKTVTARAMDAVRPEVVRRAVALEYARDKFLQRKRDAVAAAESALTFRRDRKRSKRKKAGGRQARSRSSAKRSTTSKKTVSLKSWLPTAGRAGAETGGGRWRGINRLIEKASATLVDQCVVSGGNFLLNVVLARTLAQSDYGEFALFLGAIFLGRTVDYSFISYPVSIRLFGLKDDERAALLGKTAVLAVALSLVLVVAMALGAMLLGGLAILLPVCLCYLCWQAQETLRRFVLADFRYRAAVAGDAVAYVGQGLLVAILLYFDSVTLPLALYAMSATFAAGALVHASKLRFAWPDRREMKRELPGLALDYIAVGKWSVVSYQLVLVRVQLLPWILAAAVGTAATASFQAAMNIASMMNPVVLGIGNAIPQTAAQAHRSGGVTGAARAVSGYVLFGLGPLLVMCAAGVLMPGLILSTVYGASSPYLAVVFSVQVLVVAGVFDYIAEMFSKTLLGVESGRLALVVNAVAVATCLVLALTFIDSLGVVVGASLALLIANVARALLGAAAIGWLMMREKSHARPRLTTIGNAIDDVPPGRLVIHRGSNG
jgi:O-antigen/teichoic acid export membrane protein